MILRKCKMGALMLDAINHTVTIINTYTSLFTIPIALFFGYSSWRKDNQLDTLFKRLDEQNENYARLLEQLSFLRSEVQNSEGAPNSLDVNAIEDFQKEIIRTDNELEADFSLRSSFWFIIFFIPFIILFYMILKSSQDIFSAIFFTSIAYGLIGYQLSARIYEWRNDSMYRKHANNLIRQLKSSFLKKNFSYIEKSQVQAWIMRYPFKKWRKESLVRSVDSWN